MNSYLVILSNKQSSRLSEELLKAHIAYLKRMRHAKRLPTCGSFTDNTGAVLVVRATSLTEAKAIVKADPFVSERYYETFSLYEFVEVEDGNGWLNYFKNIDDIRTQMILAQN